MNITEKENKSESLFNKKEIFCKIKSPYNIQDLKLNPNYLNILLVGTRKQINLFNIPQKSQEELIKKPKFIFNKNAIGFNFAVFNPFNSHIIACAYDEHIQIWSVRRPVIHKIDCLDEPINMKWEKINLLGFIEKYTIIKIYDNIKKKIIFNLDFNSEINFDFFGNNTILVCDKDNNKIYEYEFSLDPEKGFEIKEKEKYKRFFEMKYKFFLVYNEYFLINSNENDISLYDDLNNKIYNNKSFLNNPKIIKSAKQNIIFKILDLDKDCNCKLVIIEDNFEILNKEKISNIEDNEDNEESEENSSFSENESFENSLEDINKDYFEDCPEKFIHIIENLNFKYNEYNDKYKKEKKYMVMDELKINLEKVQNLDLISLRNNVKEEMEKTKSFKTKKDEYLFFLNLIIKDETNINLLKEYLLFLKNNEMFLEKEKIPHENFIDELNYYSVFFEKDELKKLFGFEFKSEKTKLIQLIKEYYNSLNNNTLKELKKKLKDENKRRYFNQPISFNLKELIYYDCYDTIYYDIIFNKNNNKQKLENKLYILEEILKRKIIEQFEEVDVLIPLFSYIYYAQPKKKVEFFLNSIYSKTLTDEELEKNSEIYKYEVSSNKIKKFFHKENEIYENPKELCLKNLDEKCQNCEKYNYKYMIENPPLKLKIENIKELILITLKSKVFKEAFQYLTGKENYENIFNNNMISEFINNLKFLPIEFSSIVAFHNRLNFITIISTMKKDISNCFKYNDEKISLTLENGIIVTIIYHEFGNAINTVISFKENKMKSNNTPRKTFLKYKEGGRYLELILFGKAIDKLTLGEALYVLNLNNYEKSLEEFRKGFLELNDKDLIIKGPFEDFNIENISKIDDEMKREIFIKAKNENGINNILKDAKISIPLLDNDVIGRTNG